MLIITDTAANALLSLIERKSLSADHGLRISVEKGGCAGLQYVMNIEPPRPDDLRMEHKTSANFYLAANCADMLKGCQIDYALSLNDTGFKISNPNATRSCGCGTSFESSVSAPPSLPEGKPCTE